MHDIRQIREAPNAFDAALARRGLPPVAGEIVALDETRRIRIAAAEAALAERNAASREVGAAKSQGNNEEFERLRALFADKKAEIAGLEAEADAADKKVRDLLMKIPNLPYEDVPDGPDETANVEIHRWGSPRNFSHKPLEHFAIPSVAPLFDFEAAARLSGSRFVVMKGALVRLHRALAQFMLDTHVDRHGLTEVWTPVLVRDEAMIGTGQLPKFKEDSFLGASLTGREGLFSAAFDQGYRESDASQLYFSNTKEATKRIILEILERADSHEEFWLIPTSEVTLTNLVAGKILDEAELPIRMTAHTQCFRSEAGSAGKDTAGMLRQHQFEKVEMVSITRPEDSRAEQERMTECAQNILEALNLPYRTVVLATGDMGFGARRTHDLEVWLPGQDTYREISSVSDCGDFQARRMNARFRRGEGAKPEFVHTLNGSGLAVGRTLIAVLENGQEADGSITLPPVLAPYLGGRLRIGPDGRFEDVPG
jgi:seryl-tRNA synthetase